MSKSWVDLRREYVKSLYGKELVESEEFAKSLEKLKTLVDTGFVKVVEVHEKERNELVGMSLLVVNKYRIVPSDPYLSCEENYCTLNGVFILPKYQNQGYGNSLIKKSLEVAKDNGFERVELACKVERVPFFSKNGFVQYYNNATNYAPKNTILLGMVYQF